MELLRRNHTTMKPTQKNDIKNKKIRYEHPFWVWKSIQIIPKMLESCYESDVQKNIHQITQECQKRSVHKAIFLGRGSSYFAGLSIKFFFEKITHLPVSCFVSNVFDAYSYEKYDSKTAAFILSHSGKSEGDIQIVHKLKSKGAYTIGVTDILDSNLAQAVDQLLIGPGGAKIEHPATRTYATAIFRMMLLASSIAETSGTDEELIGYQQALETLPGQMASFVPDFEKNASEVAKILKDNKSNIIIGFGPNFPNAEEAAMALNQSSGIPSLSYELENYIHGPIQALTNNAGVIFIAPPGKLQYRMFGLISAARIIGAKTILLTSENCDIPDVDFAVRLPTGIPELISPVAYMIPLWQIGYHLGLLRNGAHPDRLSMDKPEFQEALTHIMKEDKWVTKKF